MNLGLNLFMVNKPVDEGLVDLLRGLANDSPSIEEKMKVGNMFVSDWDLFDSPHPLIHKQHRDLSMICQAMLNAPVEIYDAWFHIYRSGSAFGRHWHVVPNRDVNAQFSLVYYLERGDENDTGCLKLYEPNILIEPQPGMIVLFPSAVYHEVLEYHGERERVILACNLQQLAPG